MDTKLHGDWIETTPLGELDGAQSPGRQPAQGADSPARVRVWDRFVRVFHWSLVACMAGAYLLEDVPRLVHEILGYTALALVAARIVWGFVGRGHARFASFVPGPRRLAGYVGAMVRGEEPRHLGHNPAAAVMILFLLAMVLAIGVSGFLMTTDAFWGDEFMEDLHTTLVDVVLVAVALHVAAAVYESWKHRENLVASMFSGFKRAPSSHD